MPDLESQLRDVVERAIAPLDVDRIVAARRTRRQRRRIAIAATVVVALVAATVGVLSQRTTRSKRQVAVNDKPTVTPLDASLAQLVLVSPGGGTSALASAIHNVEVRDPVSGSAGDATLPLPTAKSSLFPFLVVGHSLVAVINTQTGPFTPAIGSAYAFSATFDRAVPLGDASFAFKSNTDDRVWLETDNATPDQRLHGTEYGTRRTVQEVNLQGKVTSPQYALTDGRTPVAAVNGAFVTERATGRVEVTEIWDPATNRVSTRFPDNSSVLAVSSSSVVWIHCGSACVLRMTNVESGIVSVLEPPAGMQWSPDRNGSVVFSPDGARLALVGRPLFRSDGLAIPPGRRPAVITIVGVATGERVERRVDAWNANSLLPQWSPDGNVLFFGQDATHVAYFVATDQSSSLHTTTVQDASAFLVVPRAAPPVGTSPTQRYEVDAMVSQSHLCVYPGTVLTSTGSQCFGPLVLGWHYADGNYHLVGTYDGTFFALTQPPSTYHAQTTPLPDFTTPCATPPGGWRITNPSLVKSIDNYKAMQSAAQSAPDYAGMWSDSKTPTVSSVEGFGITNIAFTGSLDAHRAQLAPLWGGPICVLQRPRAYHDLEKIRDELTGATGEHLGLQLISAGPDDLNDRVSLQVIAATAGTQHALDVMFGAGVVKVDSVLRPMLG